MKAINDALKEADPVEALKKIADTWSAKGMSKEKVFGRFKEFFNGMQGNRYTEFDEDYILQVIDYIDLWEEKE